MRELFGTDGVRGIANKDLTVHLSLRIARAAATVLRRCGDTRPRVVIGRDTRISGDMVEAALIAGFCSAGADVLPLGVLPTAGIAYLARMMDVDMGVVISASHNPFEFNGIKFFSHEGYKLPDAVELEIEALVTAGEHLDHPQGDQLGRLMTPTDEIERYLQYLRALVPDGLQGLRLVVDCANGAASDIAPALLRELGAEVTCLYCTPDGVNINAGCGATHPEVVAQAVRELGADAGLSFDGDADRLLLSDEQGRVVNGDRIMALAGYALHRQGQLPGGVIVGTVMSNLGLERGLERLGMRLVRTQVGDRYVLEEMQRIGATLGGEQSGHVIFLDHATTGDGLVTALMVMKILRAAGEPLSKLAALMEDYPQKLININVTSVKGWDQHEVIRQAIARAEADLGADGRILVRASGTEPKIRVMVEALQSEKVEWWTGHVAEVIREHLTV
ncbi:MAG TPA: phosphoglucosamine mutase [Armatimonadota bacterium]